MAHLKQHLLPRIQSNLKTDGGESLHEINASRDQTCITADTSILFKSDRIYEHNIMRVNFTAYDVRRLQDVINPSTTHCNVMVLAGDNLESSSATHPFRYARVLGIHHVNAIYVGPGMIDYRHHRMEFLWVRWYRIKNPGGWNAKALDRLEFPSPMEDGAFGFVDPSDVLRSSHIIPVFAKNKRYHDGKGLSFRGRDSSDWKEYYLNRYVISLQFCCAADQFLALLTEIC